MADDAANTPELNTTTGGTPPAPPAWLKRRLSMPRWGVIAVAVGVVALVGSAAGRGPTQKEFDSVSAERDEALSDLADAQAAIQGLDEDIVDLKANMDQAASDSEAAIQEAEDARTKAIAERSSMEDERDAAEDRATQAEADRDEVLARFDPEIQAAIASLVANADQTVCAAGDAAGFSGQPIPLLDAALQPIVGTIPEVALPGGPSDYLSMPDLEARLQSCYEAGKQRGTLQGPHGDGFFTIGLEMAPGHWRSDGQGSSCYWQISPDGNPDDILSNHFGNAGGTVTLREGQEFESDGCGTWTLVG